jgi:hypothetical protein
MATLENIGGILGKAEPEELSQAFFGTLPIIIRVHRSDEVVTFHEPIKG